MSEAAFQVSLLDHGTAAAEVHRLFQRAYTVEAALLQVTDFPPLARTQADIESADSEFLGVHGGAGLIAVVELERAPGQVLIASLVVDPDFFRQGIARNFLGHVIAACECQSLVVETATANLPALKLYQAMGFALDSEHITGDGIRMARLRFVGTAD